MGLVDKFKGIASKVALSAYLVGASLGCSDNSYENVPVDNIVRFYFSKVEKGQKFGGECRGVAKDNYIITAKHCVDDIVKDKLKVKFNDGYSICKIKKINMHRIEDIAKVVCEYSDDKKYGKHNPSRGNNKFDFSDVDIGDSVYFCVDDYKTVVNDLNSIRGFFDRMFYKGKVDKYFCFKGEFLKMKNGFLMANIPVRQGYSGSGLFDKNGNLVAISSRILGKYSLYHDDGAKLSDESYFVPIKFIEAIK